MSALGLFDQVRMFYLMVPLDDPEMLLFHKIFIKTHYTPGKRDNLEVSMGRRKQKFDSDDDYDEGGVIGEDDDGWTKPLQAKEGSDSVTTMKKVASLSLFFEGDAGSLCDTYELVEGELFNMISSYTPSRKPPNKR